VGLSGSSIASAMVAKDVLTMFGEQNPITIKAAYDKLMARSAEQYSSEMCWPVEWYPEHLPTESSTGNSILFHLQSKADPLGCIDGGQWPQVDNSEVKAEDVLVFTDSNGN